MTNKKSAGDVEVYGAYATDRQEFDYWMKAESSPVVQTQLDSWAVLGYEVVKMKIKDMELACWSPDRRKRLQ